MSAELPVGEYELLLQTLGNTITDTNKIGLLTSSYSDNIDPNAVATIDEITDGGDGSTSDGSTGDGSTSEEEYKTLNPLISYVAEVTNIQAENNIYTWSAVKGATAYKLTFTDESTSTVKYTTYVANFKG